MSEPGKTLICGHQRGPKSVHIEGYVSHATFENSLVSETTNNEFEGFNCNDTC